MTVPSGMRNFFGVPGLSVKNQPPRFAALEDGLYSSTASLVPGELASTSFTTIGGKSIGGGLASPGVPPSVLLGRQLAGSPQVFNGAFGFTSDNEKP